MTSLRAKYNLIVNGMNTLEKEDGFMDYRLGFLDKDSDQKSLVMDIQRIFVDEAKRGQGYAGQLVDEAIALVEKELEKDEKKVKRLLGHVQGPDGMKETSLKAQFKYGFKIAKIEMDHIILVKELP